MKAPITYPLASSLVGLDDGLVLKELIAVWVQNLWGVEDVRIS